MEKPHLKISKSFT